MNDRGAEIIPCELDAVSTDGRTCSKPSLAAPLIISGRHESVFK